MSAAANSGEPLLAAMGAWRLSYVVTSRKHPQEARELYAAAGAERGLAECHERLDELLEALAPPPREGHRR